MRRAGVIARLAEKGTVGLDAADMAAAELGVSRRQVYVPVGRWRAGEGVVSDLLPGRSSGGRGGGRLPDEVEGIVRDVLQKRYLTRQRRSVAAVCREIARECEGRGLRVPSRGTVLRRIAKLDPVSSVAAREGRDAARPLRSAGGTPPEITGLLEQVQADHTPVDVIVVDERHRLPIGRPYVTAAIDVASRCVVGLVVTLEAPSATSVGLCLARTPRPMSGKPRELYVDNAAEFKSEALRRERLGRFVLRRDPRDISRIWALDPDGAAYLEVSYRTLSRPSISVWEQQAAVARLRDLGRAEVDENALFTMVAQMREITDTAAATTRKVRRDRERRPRRAWAETLVPG